MKATNLHKRKRSKKVSPLKSKFPLKMDSFYDKSPVVLSELSKSVNETDRDQSSFHQQNVESGATLKSPLVSDPFSAKEIPPLLIEGRAPKHFDVLILKKINPMD